MRYGPVLATSLTLVVVICGFRTSNPIISAVYGGTAVVMAGITLILIELAKWGRL